MSDNRVCPHTGREHEKRYYSRDLGYLWWCTECNDWLINMEQQNPKDATIARLEAEKASLREEAALYQKEWAILREEVERLKAVLEGAQYQNIDNLKNESVEKCRAIGSTAALLTINLRSRLAEAEGKVEKAREAMKSSSSTYSVFDKLRQILK